jgi:predicted DNA-binding transcriptional regulator AlpA
MSGNVEAFIEDLIERIAARVAERIPQAPAAAPTSAPLEYLTTKQAAKLLGMSTSSLEGWRSRDQGPAWVKIGTAVRYPRDGIDSFVASRTKGKKK